MRRETRLCYTTQDDIDFIKKLGTFSESAFVRLMERDDLLNSYKQALFKRDTMENINLIKVMAELDKEIAKCDDSASKSR